MFWWVVAVLVFASSQAVWARRSLFVREVIVTSNRTPPPMGEAEWVQVPERGKLNRIIQHPTSSYRNFWLPVRFDEGLFAADTLNIATYYRNLGYLDAYVESTAREPVESASGEMQLVDLIVVLGGIQPTERYRLTGIRFEGIQSLDTTSLGREFRKRHGKDGYFSPAATVENLFALRTAYADAGYLDTTAVAIRQSAEIDAARRTVEERYDVIERAPVRVAGIRIVNGNAPAPLKTDSIVIAQALTDAKLHEGSLFGRQRTLDAESNLFDLGVFRRARVIPDTAGDNPRSRRYAVADVAERDAWDIRTQIGYSSIERWRASESVLYHNFLGEARLIGQEAQLAQKNQYVSLLYGQPRIGFPRLVPLVGGTSIRLRLDHVLSAQWEIIDAREDTSGVAAARVAGDDQSGTSSGTISGNDTTRTLRWKVTVSRRFGRIAQLGLSYDISRTDSRLSDPLVQGALTLSATYDTRDDFLRPSKGLAVTAQVKLANLGVDPREISLRPEGLVQYYHRLTPRLIGAFSLGGGAYYLGPQGAFDRLAQYWRSEQTPTVRGVARNEITGGDPAMAYVLAKVEARISLWKWLGLAFFMDAGQGWTRARVPDAELHGWSAMRAGRYAVSTGFGPRIEWLLPVRLDIARPLRGPAKWRYEFGIGQAF